MGTIKNNLTNALFSKTQQSVLGLLFGQSDRAFYTNEIIRLCNAGTGTIQRELEKLNDSGLITVKQIGNQNHYQANPKSPLFSELRSIVIKTFGLADIIREALKPFAAKIQLSFIYGSIAKQQDSANSDIDLLLIADDLTFADVFKHLQKAELKLSRPINPTIYTPSEWKRKLKNKNNFLNSIMEQPKIFLIGNENELSEFR